MTRSYTYQYSFIFLLFLYCKLTHTLPFMALLTNRSQTAPPTFSLRWLQKFPKPSNVIDWPLIFDSNLDAALDVYFTTIDGTFFGIPTTLSKLDSSRTASSRASWSVPVRGEHFISSPVPVSIDSQGHSLLLLASAHGTLYLFDDSGNQVTHIQVPDVLVTLDTSDPVDSALLTIPPNLANRVRWAKGQSLDENTWRLVPKIYTTPTVLTASGVQLSLDSPASELLTICVTFVSPNSHSQGLALAALVGLSRAALLSSSLWGSSSFDLDRSLTLVPLELGSLAQSNPPYLLSSPVLVSEPLMHSAFSSPSTFSMLVTTFSGRLYKVPLPLGRDTSTPDVLWNFTGQSSVSLSCVPMDCPPKSSSASTSSNFLSESRLCCLLLDDSSHLRLIDISPLDKRAKHPSARLRWEYSPEPGTAPVDSLSQLGHSSLVPIDCDNRPHVTCHLWAVYPTTDGSVHAVDFNTGAPVAGYPVKLFVPEKPDSGNAFSVGLRTFASGPGLLYTAPGSSLWMLFADTLGRFYHVQMRTNPIVLTSGKCLFGCENKPDRRVYPVNTWITPVPIVHKSPWSPLQGQMAFLVTNTSGLGLLTVDRSLDPFTLGQSSSHGSYNFHTFDAVFLDNSGQPVDVIHMDPNQQSIRYALRNCLSWSIASDQLDYAVRQMELRTFLEPLFPSDDTVGVGWKHFCLLLSHGDCTHELLLCELLRYVLGTHITRHLGVSTNDCQRDEASSFHKYVFIALQYPVKWYQRVVDPFLRQSDEKMGWKMINVADFMRQEYTKTSIGDSATSDLSGPMSDSFGDRVLEYINTQVNEFLDAVPATTSTIVVDNLICLLDLGLTTRQLDRLLVKWNRATDGHTRLIVGCHVGQMFDDVAASETEPTFVHFIHMCRARASILLELRPLSTGYSQTLDGKLSVTQRHSTTNRISPHVQKSCESVRTFHYYHDGSRAICYPPGTSKLVT